MWNGSDCEVWAGVACNGRFVTACGAAAGSFAATASSGFARNLRKDMYYQIQNYSFENIDKFSTSLSGDKADDGYYQCAAGVHDDCKNCDPLPR